MPVTMSNHSHEENWFELLTRPLWGLAAAKDAVPDDTLGRPRRRSRPRPRPRRPLVRRARPERRPARRRVRRGRLEPSRSPREKLWDPLDAKAKDNVAAWLTAAYDRARATQLALLPGLRRARPQTARRRARPVGRDRAPRPHGGVRPRRPRLRGRPGRARRLLQPVRASTPTRCCTSSSCGDDRFVPNAAAFARKFRSWFAADGAAVPYGRSLGYRFAQGPCGARWPPPTWRRCRGPRPPGFARRHLEWWWEQADPRPRGAAHRRATPTRTTRWSSST